MEELLKLLLAVSLGVLIGLEREKRRFVKGEVPIGARSFAILSLLGYLIALTKSEFLLALSIASFILFSTELYRHTKFKGTTTIFSATAIILIGYIVYTNYILACASTILILVLLASKEKIVSFAKVLEYEELIDFIKFGIILFIVYPILPENPIDPWGFLNLKKVWKMVILISLFNFVGYVANRLIGKRGLIIAGLAGGITSSTAVSLTMAGISRRNEEASTEAAGAVAAATATMFLRVLILSSLVCIKLALYILPFSFLSTLLGYLVSFIVWKRSKGNEKVEFGTPFNISDALKFGVLFGIILFSAGVAHRYFGTKGLFAVSAASGITDVDAINLTISSLVCENEILVKTGAIALFIAILVNQIVKLSICFGGSRKLRRMVALFYAIMTLPWLGIFL